MSVTQSNGNPTEDCPENGSVLMFGEQISLAERWVEDGIHVIRSTEFDVIAGSADFAEAVAMFGEKTLDLWRYLSGVGSLTDNEAEVLGLLSSRFLGVLEAVEKAELERRRRMISINFRRRRSRGDDHLGQWRPHSGPQKSRRPLPA